MLTKKLTTLIIKVIIKNCLIYPEKRNSIMKNNSKIQIGESEVYTTKLGLGTNKVGGHNLYPNLDDKKGKEIIKTALDQGISFLDTAFGYGFGRSEELIGQVLKNYPRNQVIIADKAGIGLNKNEAVVADNTPKLLKHWVDLALQRLHTDYIDIFFIHHPDQKTPKDEAIAALAGEKKAGKIKAIGVSNFSLDQLKQANQNNQVDIVEDNYSLAYRDKEKTLFPYLKAHQISFSPYFPLASGLLTGKYGLSDQSHFSRYHQYTKEEFSKIVQGVDALKPIAKKHQISVTQLVLAWYIKNPNISVVIPGAKNVKQVLDNAKALTVHLTGSEFKTIDNLFKF